ncbi:MAG: hypothetical protein AB1817_01760 [Chloroflexota bacterium]
MSKLQSARPCLIVSIPGNHADMARAAEAAGADAIKLHINVTHHATGITFGALEQERAALEKILAAVRIPVGLVPGEDLAISSETLDAIAAMGFTFVDGYAHTLPAWVRGGKMDYWAAINPTYAINEIKHLADLPWVDVIEAAIIPTEAYGQLLSIRDLARYRELRQILTKPFVVPSQRRLRVEDVPGLLAVGAKNIMIGAVVTGMDVAGVEKMTRAFRKALDA